MLAIDVTSVGFLGFFAWGLLGVIVTWLADRAVERTRRGRRFLPADQVATANDPVWAPPITVLKPVKGIDEGLADNLLSFLRQDHPNLEILVGAAQWSDPALVLARELAAAHPHVRLTTVLCPEDGGLNPKVSILRTLAQRARNDLILISDSNVRVRPGYVRITAQHMRDPRVGLVTNPIVGDGEQSVGAVFEGLHLTTYVARALTFAAAYFHRACVVGKSMLFRLSDLNRLGGWDSVRDVLAEDYVIGNAFEQAGFRVITCPEVVYNYNRGWSIGRFVSRHLRWGQMRRRTCLSAYVVEPISNPTPFLLCAAGISLGSGRGIATWLPASLLLIAARWGLDWRALRRARTARLPAAMLLWTIPKDVLVLGIWMVAWFRRSLVWRGHRLIINAGTRLTRAPALDTQTSRPPPSRPQTAFPAPRS